jgi:hypothetical protein
MQSKLELVDLTILKHHRLFVTWGSKFVAAGSKNITVYTTEKQESSVPHLFFQNNQKFQPKKKE